MSSPEDRPATETAAPAPPSPHEERAPSAADPPTPTPTPDGSTSPPLDGPLPLPLPSDEEDDEEVALVGARRKALLRASAVSKYYPVQAGWFGATRFVRAVDDVSLYIRRGETLALIGESGCGKTTLGRTLLRLTEPTYGRIAFDGVEILALGRRSLRALRRKMQIVFQDPYSSLNPKMTAGQAVGEPIRIHRLAAHRKDEAEQVAALLQKVGLSADAAERYPHEFSGGERQRIAIARALASRPEFVVCDEPVGALDVSVQARIINLLVDLQSEFGLAYLFISHDLKVVHHLAHRVAVMYLGRVVETGSVADVFHRPAHPYTRALLSAVPVPDPARRRLRIILEGEVASPLAPPSGCAFHPRCPRARSGACEQELPILTKVGADDSRHAAACFFPEMDD